MMSHENDLYVRVTAENVKQHFPEMLGVRF